MLRSGQGSLTGQVYSLKRRPQNKAEVTVPDGELRQTLGVLDPQLMHL